MSPYAIAVTTNSTTRPAKRIAQGSPQQDTFWDALVGGDAHLLSSARAGTGKSATCREGMHRLAETNPTAKPRCSYVAFNRSIASEFGQDLPSGSTATTMHSAGFSALRANNPGIGEPSKFKLWDAAHAINPKRNVVSKKIKSSAVKLTGLCKSLLIGHEANSLRHGANPSVYTRICAAYGIDCGGVREEVYEMVPKLMKASLDQSGVVDFNDMIWLPVVLGLEFPPIDFLFVDEAQDLDPCQHALVRQMVGDGRMVVVGDPYQAIYAFRGADSSSMDTLSAQLNKTPRGLDLVPLTQTRRCPSGHVNLARRIVPDFEALPEAPQGEWTENVSPGDVLTPGVMGLCRNNAPLVQAAFRLAARGVPVGIQGRDIGEGLAKFVEDFEAADLPELSRDLGDYRAGEISRLADLDDAEAEIAAVTDRVNCVYAVMRGKSTPGQVSQAIRDVFKDVDARQSRRHGFAVLGPPGQGTRS